MKKTVLELSKEVAHIDRMQKKVLDLIHKLYKDKNPDKAEEETKNEYLSEIGPIENAYIVSNYTVPQLGRLFNMTKDVIYRYSMKYNWLDKRKEYQLCYKQEMQDTLKKTIITNEIQVNERHYSLWNRVLDYTEKELNDPDAMSILVKGPYKGKLNVSKLMNLCTIINQAQSGQRISMGLASAEKMIDEQIATDRLQLEKVRLGLLDEKPEEKDNEPDITKVVKESINDIWNKKGDKEA